MINWFSCHYYFLRGIPQTRKDRHDSKLKTHVRQYQMQFPWLSEIRYLFMIEGYAGYNGEVRARADHIQ